MAHRAGYCFPPQTKRQKQEKEDGRGAASAFGLFSGSRCIGNASRFRIIRRLENAPEARQLRKQLHQDSPHAAVMSTMGVGGTDRPLDVADLVVAWRAGEIVRGMRRR
jgi:hypothetical protein